MDYKYIEQLLDRYFAAETSLEEEDILRTFFSQKGIPAELEQYRALFLYPAVERQEVELGDDFDQRLLGMLEDDQQEAHVVKAREIRLSQRLMPLFKAAAVVAIFLTLGQAAQTPWDASWNSQLTDRPEAVTAQQQDSITATPIQAENFSDVLLDSAKAIPSEVLPKD
jgi:hypothetical protein